MPDAVCRSLSKGSLFVPIPADQAVKRTAAGEPTHVDAVRDEAAEALPLLVVILIELGEAILLGDVNLLASGELELGATQGLDGDGGLLLLCADRQDHLANAGSCHSAVALTPSTTHTCLQTIGAGA